MGSHSCILSRLDLTNTIRYESPKDHCLQSGQWTAGGKRGSGEMGSGTGAVAHIGAGGGLDQTVAVKIERSGWAQFWKQDWQDLGWAAWEWEGETGVQDGTWVSG